MKSSMPIYVSEGTSDLQFRIELEELQMQFSTDIDLTKEQRTLQLMLNELFTIEKISSNSVNMKVLVFNKEEISKFKKAYPSFRFGKKHVYHDLFTTFSLVATITGVLTGKYLAFIIDTKTGVIEKVVWLQDAL